MTSDESCFASQQIQVAMSPSGQNLRLPPRSIGIRFTSVSRHYASEAYSLHGVSTGARLRLLNRGSGLL